jgi:hypothetical protein
MLLDLETAWWTFICSVWGCSSPGTYCQPAAAAGFIYYSSQGWVITLTSSSWLCLFKVLLDACPFSFLQCMALPACCNCSSCLFTVHMGKCSSPTLWGCVSHISHCWKSSPLQAHCRGLCHTCLLQLACLFRVHVRKCPFPSLRGNMPLISLCWKLSPLEALCGNIHPCLLLQVCLFRVHVGKCPSPSLGQSVPHREASLPLTREPMAPHPLCHVSFFSVACLLSNFGFFCLLGVFCRVRVSLSRGLCWFFSRVAMGEPCAFIAHLWVCQAG